MAWARQSIAKCGERLGIYYLETGSAIGTSKVVYDRAHSSISTATAADFDFDQIFAGADWFHLQASHPRYPTRRRVLHGGGVKSSQETWCKGFRGLEFQKEAVIHQRRRRR